MVFKTDEEKLMTFSDRITKMLNLIAYDSRQIMCLSTSARDMVGGFQIDLQSEFCD